MNPRTQASILAALKAMDERNSPPANLVQELAEEKEALNQLELLKATLSAAHHDFQEISRLSNIFRQSHISLVSSLALPASLELSQQRLHDLQRGTERLLLVSDHDFLLESALRFEMNYAECLPNYQATYGTVLDCMRLYWSRAMNNFSNEISFFQSAHLNRVLALPQEEPLPQKSSLTP